MSNGLMRLIFFNFVLISFTTSHTIAGKRKLEAANETSSKRIALNKASPFDSLPAEIIEMIFQKLPQADLKNIRLVDKRLNEIATRQIQVIRIPAQTPDKDLLLFQQFVKRLRNFNLKFPQKPSGAVLKLFFNTPVKMLQIDNKGINVQDICDLAPCFPSNLQGLDLSKNSIRDAGAQALANYLSNNLLQLNLAQNNIGFSGIKALAPRFSTKLKKLDLSWNNIEDSGLKMLAPYLSNSLLELDLSKNNIGTEGIKALAPRFSTKLKKLDLSWNNIEDSGLKMVALYLSNSL
ncbi:MAG: F-box-like domain-containing protein, partial [Alphaproteobacteria bacterium]